MLLLEIQDVGLRVKDRAERETEILHAVGFSVERGSRHVLLGPSGSGKTTLLRLLCRLAEPTSGRILLAGRDIRDIEVTALRRRCAYVHQQAAPLPGSVADNLLAGPRLRRSDLEQARGRLPRLLDRVHLGGDLMSRDAADLSAGQMQRLALARALMNDPEVLLLDEPTAALDPGTAAAVLDLVAELNSRLGLTVVLVTHAFNQARRIATGGGVIIDGRLRATGGAEVLLRSSDDCVAEFLRSEGGG